MRSGALSWRCGCQCGRDTGFDRERDCDEARWYELLCLQPAAWCNVSQTTSRSEKIVVQFLCHSRGVLRFSSVSVLHSRSTSLCSNESVSFAFAVNFGVSVCPWMPEMSTIGLVLMVDLGHGCVPLRCCGSCCCAQCGSLGETLRRESVCGRCPDSQHLDTSGRLSFSS